MPVSPPDDSNGADILQCSVYGISSGASTDWARRNLACGLIGKQFPKDETRIIDRLKHAPRKTIEQLDGQIQMEF